MLVKIWKAKCCQRKLPCIIVIAIMSYLLSTFANSSMFSYKVLSYLILDEI